jgi:hypothetical protein
LSTVPIAPAGTDAGSVQFDDLDGAAERILLGEPEGWELTETGLISSWK